jgi:hypothetical protein
VSDGQSGDAFNIEAEAPWLSALELGAIAALLLFVVDFFLYEHLSEWASSAFEFMYFYGLPAFTCAAVILEVRDKKGRGGITFIKAFSLSVTSGFVVVSISYVLNLMVYGESSVSLFIHEIIVFIVSSLYASALLKRKSER